MRIRSLALLVAARQPVDWRLRVHHEWLAVSFPRYREGRRGHPEGAGIRRELCDLFARALRPRGPVSELAGAPAPDPGLGSLADQEKVAWYLWLHEFDDIPQRFRVAPRGAADEQIARSVTGEGSSASFRLGSRVNMDDPALADYLRDRYERLLRKCPTAAGLVLTLHESDNKLFRNAEVQSKLSVPDRIVFISKLIYDVVKKHNKKLILRNFFYEPKEMEFFAQALTKLPDDIIVMSKDVVHDFDPWYPYDPLHGKVGKKLQIMEVDLCVEKAWSQQGLYAQPEYLKRVVERARDTGLAGAVGRNQVVLGTSVRGHARNEPLRLLAIHGEPEPRASTRYCWTGRRTRHYSGRGGA